MIWRQEPKFRGRGHYGHRLAFSPDGRHLFISSGERQEFTPAQDRNSNAGKIIRLTDTGMVPSDNPFLRSGAGHLANLVDGPSQPARASRSRPTGGSG